MERYKPPIDRPSFLVSQFLGDTNILRGLLKNPEGDIVFKRAQRTIHSFSDYETTDFVQQLVHGLGKENKFWNVNRRDGALILLNQAIFAKADMESVQNTYTVAVDQIQKDSDPLGSVDSLLEAGKIMAPYFPDTPESKKEVHDAWKCVKYKFYWQDRADWRAISPKVTEIVKLHGVNPDSEV